MSAKLNSNWCQVNLQAFSQVRTSIASSKAWGGIASIALSSNSFSRTRRSFLGRGGTARSSFGDRYSRMVSGDGSPTWSGRVISGEDPSESCQNGGSPKSPLPCSRDNATATASTPSPASAWGGFFLSPYSGCRITATSYTTISTVHEDGTGYAWVFTRKVSRKRSCMILLRAISSAKTFVAILPSI